MACCNFTSKSLSAPLLSPSNDSIDRPLLDRSQGSTEVSRWTLSSDYELNEGDEATTSLMNLILDHMVGEPIECDDITLECIDRDPSIDCNSLFFDMSNDDAKDNDGYHGIDIPALLKSDSSVCKSTSLRVSLAVSQSDEMDLECDEDMTCVNLRTSHPDEMGRASNRCLEIIVLHNLSGRASLVAKRLRGFVAL